jgi:hypothetical protein
MSRPRPSSSVPPGGADCFDAVTSLLDRLDMTWAVAGALAAMAYRADERPTTDVDLLAAPDDRLVAALVDEGFDARLFEEDGEPYLVRANRGDCLVDILFPVTEYQRVALARATDHVLSVEDVIVHKLIAWRQRDRADVDSILSTDVAVDESYVEQWAVVWGVQERWAEARRQR